MNYMRIIFKKFKARMIVGCILAVIALLAEMCIRDRCNELLKSMDKERYEQSNQQFEKKYMRFTQLMNYHN